MKKFILGATSAAMLVLCGITSVGCSTTPSESTPSENVSSPSNNDKNVSVDVSISFSDLEIGGQNFSNVEGLTITHEENSTEYIVSGSASTMTDEQAEALDNEHFVITDKYIIVDITYSAGATLSYTQFDEKTSIKNETLEDQTSRVVVPLTSETVELSKTFNFYITYSSETITTAYTLDLKNIQL